MNHPENVLRTSRWARRQVACCSQVPSRVPYYTALARLYIGHWQCSSPGNLRYNLPRPFLTSCLVPRGNQEWHDESTHPVVDAVTICNHRACGQPGPSPDQPSTISYSVAGVYTATHPMRNCWVLGRSVLVDTEDRGRQTNSQAGGDIHLLGQ